MTATYAQVRLLMKERGNGKTQQQAAVKVNLHHKTVQKYEQLGQLPSELKEARRYRTRPDPFEKDWAEVEAKLAVAPELEAKAVFQGTLQKLPPRNGGVFCLNGYNFGLSIESKSFGSILLVPPQQWGGVRLTGVRASLGVRNPDLF
jgi:hypothetical protein